MAIFDFLRVFFGKDKSAVQAKERLRIVLIQDQSSVSPELLDTLRGEMVKVVNRYLEIDSNQVEMGIQRKNSAITLEASIPIIRVRKEGRVPPRRAPEEDSIAVKAAAAPAKGGSAGEVSAPAPALEPVMAAAPEVGKEIVDTITVPVDTAPAEEHPIQSTVSALVLEPPDSPPAPLEPITAAAVSNNSAASGNGAPDAEPAKRKRSRSKKRSR